VPLSCSSLVERKGKPAERQGHGRAYRAWREARPTCLAPKKLDRTRHKDMMKTFLTPTIVHFCTIVFVCLWSPSIANFDQAGRPLGLGSLIGVAYSCGVWVRIRRRYGSVTNFVDQLWYAPIPIAAYLVLAAAAFVSLTRSSILLDWIAIAVSVLLSAGIRNAWAITLWRETNRQLFD
jgi:hypothetical protein